MVRISALAVSLFAFATAFVSSALAQNAGGPPAGPQAEITRPRYVSAVTRTISLPIEQTDLTIGRTDGGSREVTIVKLPGYYCKDANGKDMPDSYLGFDQKTGALVGTFTKVDRSTNDLRPPWSGPNDIKGKCPDWTWTMTVKKTATAATDTPGGAVRAPGGGRRFDPQTQNIIELGGGFGSLFNFERSRISYTGSVIGSGGTFNQSSVDVMPDLQFWANYRPAGWNGIYLGMAADVAIPTEGAQTHGFTTSGGQTGTSMIEPRDAMFTLQGRVGMRDPLLPGSIFGEAGVRLQDYRSTVRSFTGTTLFEQFATDRLVAAPTFGIGARIPLAKVFDVPALRRVAFDTEVNFTPGSNGFSMPGSNSLSGASFKMLSSASWLAKFEYEFDCFDP